MKNNKGFSLVELIIVIAIMAILVGVMAPQLIRYIEKTKESSDIQLLDTVKSAVTTAVMDPDVVTATGVTIPTGAQDLSAFTKDDALGKAVKATLGGDATYVTNQLKSKKAGDKKITVTVDDNKVSVKCGELSVGNAAAGGSTGGDGK